MTLSEGTRGEVKGSAPRPAGLARSESSFGSALPNDGSVRASALGGTAGTASPDVVPAAMPRQCRICKKVFGYDSDAAWHIRNEHLVPFLERPEDCVNADHLTLVAEVRALVFKYVVVFIEP